MCHSYTSTCGSCYYFQVRSSLISFNHFYCPTCRQWKSIGLSNLVKVLIPKWSPPASLKVWPDGMIDVCDVIPHCVSNAVNIMGWVRHLQCLLDQSAWRHGGLQVGLCELSWQLRMFFMHLRFILTVYIFSFITGCHAYRLTKTKLNSPVLPSFHDARRTLITRYEPQFSKEDFLSLFI